MTNNRVMDWGSSMYGGYFANLIIDEKVVGIHAETQRELRAQIKEKLGVAVNLLDVCRRDN